jgi:hypothetical protein
MRTGAFGYLNAMSEAIPGAKFVKGVGQAAFGAVQGKLEKLRAENPEAYDRGMASAPKGKYDEYKNKPNPVFLPSDAGKGKNRFEKSNSSTSTSEWDDTTEGAAGMKKGGSVSARADGCAQRGKTKGRIV